MRAGFRPCKRCRPETADADHRRHRAVLAACRLLETAQHPITLATLARSAGLSTYHFHRTFKAVVGVTPKAYAGAVRTRRLQDALPNARSVTSALYDAGFNSSARFYSQAKSMLGMQPARFRANGRGETIRFAVARATLGLVLVASTTKGVCSISLGDERAQLVEALRTRFNQATLVESTDTLGSLLAQVIAMIETPGKAAALPLDIRGTAFQQRVWRALCDIPPGETLSYSEIARAIGMPQATRAVGHACGANPLAIAVPCHRAVRADGALAGYRWGIERKRQLLEREKARSRSAELVMSPRRSG
jgi:AraC family transcriptional regulator of adaptative response/methylated-DNA-[protein]-cysteine methyltransferase